MLKYFLPLFITFFVLTGAVSVASGTSSRQTVTFVVN